MKSKDRNYFKILRAGINTTYQDLGRNNLYHIGIPFSGAMDKRNFQLLNSLLQNDYNSPVIEFASVSTAPAPSWLFLSDFITP